VPEETTKEPSEPREAPNAGRVELEKPNSPDLSHPVEKDYQDDDVIVREAKQRFQRCQSWESVPRSRWIDDVKFAEGDSFNQYQWPNQIRRQRDVDERPCLTVNKVRQHNLKIINENKKNKPSIKLRATGGGATADSARVYNSIVRHIEYTSKAYMAYDTASSFQVKGGIGYIRIRTDYEELDSFDQVPTIERVPDPLLIYLDPDYEQPDATDARFAFVFDDMEDELFKRKYPEHEDAMTGATLDIAYGWRRDNGIRIAEYFRKVEVPDILYAIPGPQGPITFYKSELNSAPELVERIEALDGVRKRETTRNTIEWYLIVGNSIVERGEWVGKYIPIIPVVGEVTIIEGQLDRKGHTRALRDPQRMYNYMTSVAVEYSSLQSKSPYVAPAEAIEGLEEYWAHANTKNFSVLPYNGLDDQGNTIAPPERQQPPVSMPAALEGMKTASGEMMMASGQFESDFGQQGNERSAEAINERTAESSTSTYHFVDHLAQAIRGVGLHIIDLVPKLYDTERVMNIVAEDGVSYEVMMNPGMQQSMQVNDQINANAAQQILFNPNIGKYDVQTDVGPDWGTKRRETFHALSLILTQAPQLTQIIGDLLLQSSDFDLAEEAASRMRRMVPAQALGEGPSQAEQQLQQQVQNLGALLNQTMDDLAKEKIKVKGKDALRQVDAYKALTDRITALSKAAADAGRAIDPNEIGVLVDQVASEALETDLTDVIDATDPTLEAAAQSGSPQLGFDLPPVPGAKKAGDGSWYVANGAGQFARVE